jgi:PAS domain S-box-containing protein
MGGLIYALLNADKQEKKVRLALALMASGMLCYILAEIIWAILEIGLHQQPFPSLADGLYLMFYPLFTIGLMFLPSDQFSSRERLKIIIDIIIIMLAAALIFSDFLIGPILAKGEESSLALTLVLAYPILDFVLLFALMELLFRRRNSLDKRPMLLLFAAVIIMIASDIYFGIQSSSETYASGGAPDTGFVISYSLIGLAGILQANEWNHPRGLSAGSRSLYEHPPWIRYLPYIGVIVSYLLLIWNQSHSLPIDLSMTTLGVGGIIGLVLVRQNIALDENTSLYIESMKEINERKQAEESLRESGQFNREIISSAKEGIIVYDSKFRYLVWNQFMENLTGIPSSEAIGKTAFELFPHLIEQGIDRLLERAMAGEMATSLDTPYWIPQTSKSGWVVGTYGPCRNANGKIIGVIGIVRDITERKLIENELCRSRDELEQSVRERTEELEGKNVEMERFIYTVSHDLRTPLVGISGFLGFLKQDAENRDLKRLETDLKIINDAIAKMDQLLGETLELSRIGRVINQPEDVPFGEIVKEALDQTAERIRLKNIKVLVAQDLPVVHVDRLRIAEVIGNLIENCMKYLGEQSQPRMEIGYRLDGDQTVLFVQDNGIGIDPSQHDKVFELFYKVDRKSDGTGVGLAIVKRIIEVHGGRIWIESELGEGCTICFTLPLANYQ